MHLAPPIQCTVAGLTQDRAAPAGGAVWCRGCTRSPAIARVSRVFALLLFALPVRAADDGLTLPSGLDVSLIGRVDEGAATGPIHRFRFVAPGIRAEDHGLEQLSADMDYLCQNVALPHLIQEGAATGRIVVSLAQAATEFGVANPDIRQFFEAYSVDGNRCIWEAF
ncbi:DUF6497 family protein [Puniceibacterium sp. IMCC21224]|uniref:DUF6497 family protein n=1 Tax=Puniceibacterium sp. IMCC21224 TaxID=1618204 RepID=UPI00064D92FB|nr:DUF6497 family protein [Puniceibacterium sp. IMCC21224]KMK67691.1 hypothetical protein IMCC21224_112563 [Puniceibacterium sp. IMCC21224]